MTSVQGRDGLPNILVVEDDPRMQKVLNRLFRDEGYGVMVASDGQAGLDAFRVSAPVAVVLDLVLPKMSGRDVCKRLKEISREIPVIILSAITEVVDKVLLLELGADDYVTKPFSPRELLARVQAAVRRNRKQAPASALGRENRPLADLPSLKALMRTRDERTIADGPLSSGRSVETICSLWRREKDAF